MVHLLNREMSELWRRFLGILSQLSRAGEDMAAFALAEACRLPELALRLHLARCLMHRLGLLHGLDPGACLVDWSQRHSQVLQISLRV